MKKTGSQQRHEKLGKERKKLLGGTKVVWRALKREKIPELLILCLLITFIGTLGFFVFEVLLSSGGTHSPMEILNGLSDSFWWTCVTLTTVGYGDYTPKTIMGRAAGIFVMFAGLVVMSLITAIIASVLVERKIREDKGLESVNLTKHIVICGWNEHGPDILTVIKQAEDSPHLVVLINDLEEEQINEIKYKYRGDLDISFIKGDFVNESVLERANIPECSSVILLSDTSGRRDRSKADERVILATLAIKHMADKVRVTAELLDIENESHLKRARADEIIVRGRYSSFFLAHAALNPGVSTLMDGILSIDRKHQIVKMEVPQKLVGHSFRELFDYVRNEYRAILIGIISVSKGMSFDDLLSDDLSAIDIFIKKKFAEAGADLSVSLDQFNVMLNPDDSYQIKENDYGVLIFSEK
jgi:voltage-gated potassium channel